MKDENGLNIRPRGEYVDLGTFYDYVYRHDVMRKIEITPLVENRPADGSEYYFFLYDNFDIDPQILGVGIDITASDVQTAGEVHSQSVYLSDNSIPFGVVGSSPNSDNHHMKNKSENTFKINKNHEWLRQTYSYVRKNLQKEYLVEQALSNAIKL